MLKKIKIILRRTFSINFGICFLPTLFGQLYIQIHLSLAILHPPLLSLLTSFIKVALTSSCHTLEPKANSQS